ncbi:HD domain-containing phosphohydrolase [Sulfurivermis fontis]|uniref:HD domain-containing phosphohydrolase n=1 Tax=Sulfurivermis fontis TaxID=1972068 RepID=UPI000FDADCD4|nr:HD domain-containing phosphohydrolase [Sulfurivermis fontis]
MAAEENAVGAAVPASQAPVSILLVDDEANILAALRRLFRPLGYTVHNAESGAAALAILEQEHIDLVISDMRMPHMDGAQFLAQVAQRWPQVVRILLTGYADLDATVAAINQGHIYSYFSKPWEDNEIKLAVQHALEQKRLREEHDRLLALTQRQNQELKDLNANLEKIVAARTEELRQTNMFLELAYEQLQESYYAAIPVFANLVQLREGPGGGHGKRVGELAREIAVSMELDEDDVRHVYFAGLLHDIGKLAWPDDLLRLLPANLNAAQRKVVEKHPITGQAILMGMEPLSKTGLFIRHHHEQYDGKGYPDGLYGEKIPLGARIVAVANDYDGLRAGTLLGEELSPLDARTFLLQRRNKHYDGTVVDVCIAVLDARERGEGMIRELRLAPAELRAGMVLSRDLLGHDGVLLLTKGYKLNDILVHKIRELQQDEKQEFIVHVLAEGGDDVPHSAGG